MGDDGQHLHTCKCTCTFNGQFENVPLCHNCICTVLKLLLAIPNYVAMPCELCTLMYVFALGAHGVSHLGTYCAIS